MMRGATRPAAARMAAAACLGGALLAWAMPAQAAQPAGSRQTRDYVQAAGNTDAFERDEAATALAQSTNPQVLDFARMMIADHDQTTRALTAATARSGLAPPPMGVGSDLAPMLGALQSVRGPDFDKTYWRNQMLAHRSALVTTQMYATSGDDPAVRQAAAAALPIISAHLAMAEKMVAGSS